MWSDPIADFVCRLHNAARNRAKQMKVPHSALKLSVCKVLREEGYIADFEKIDDGGQGLIRVHLKYGPRGERVINFIKRESKAGCRRFVGVDEIPRVLNGLGTAVVSTSRGVLSDRQCREQKVGGELMFTLH